MINIYTVPLEDAANSLKLQSPLIHKNLQTVTYTFSEPYHNIYTLQL